MKLPHSRGKTQAGSTLIAALIIITVTFAAVSAALFEASGRYRISHQSSRWTQAGQAAEAGCEIGLMTAQNASWLADGWSGEPDMPGSAPVTKTVSLSSGVPSTGPISTTISVENIDLNGYWWLRIRATGSADLAAGRQSSLDTADNLLRKVSLLRDRFTNTALSAPQAVRSYEMIAEPRSPFAMPILLNNNINMGGGSLIDSFDSSDSTKSTGNLYDITKRQSNGNIGINNSTNSNLSGSYVYGDVNYTGTKPLNTTNVQGIVTSPFYKPTPTIKAPTWTSYTSTPTKITSSQTLTGGTQASPALYKVNTINLSSTDTLTLAPYATGQPSYIEIWVTGDVKNTGGSSIVIQNGVHAIIHVAGNMDVTGTAISNSTNVAANALIELITPAAGVNQNVKISGGGTMIAAINAPAADFTLVGGASLSGALVGKTLTTTGTSQIHYDEDLINLRGAGYGYKFSSIAEAVR